MRSATCRIESPARRRNACKILANSWSPVRMPSIRTSGELSNSSRGAVLWIIIVSSSPGGDAQRFVPSSSSFIFLYCYFLMPFVKHSPPSVHVHCSQYRVPVHTKNPAPVIPDQSVRL